MIKISVSQYQIEKLASWDHYANKIESLVESAKHESAELLLLPEYAGIEIACGQYDTDRELFGALQPLIQKYTDLYTDLAHRYQIYIQPGTIMVQVSPNLYANRAYFFGPKKKNDYQDKLQLTQYEKESGLLQRAREQKIFNTPLGKIGIAICYDSEFPEIVRPLTKAGASLILVPSYTTTLAGYYRVFLSCRARAIENQCYVAVSYTVNAVAVSSDNENTYGEAAILGPADTGFSDDGVIMRGKMNDITLITAGLSLDKLMEVRKHGQVHNLEDTQYCESQENREIKNVDL